MFASSGRAPRSSSPAPLPAQAAGTGPIRDRHAARRSAAWLTTAPWIWPSRDYTVYVPRGHSRWRRAPLVVLIHGCRQTADEIAAGNAHHGARRRARAASCCCRTRIRARTRGVLELVRPGDGRGAGRDGDRRSRKCAPCGASTGSIRGACSSPGFPRAARSRLCSACRKPELIAGVFVHSGIACGAASSPLAALDVLKNGADTDVAQIAREARAGSNAANRFPCRCWSIQGGADDVGCADQCRAARPAVPRAQRPSRGAMPAPHVELPAARSSRASRRADARTVTTSEWRVAGRLVARHVLIDGLGHAWSGGDDKYPYNDPHRARCHGAARRVRPRVDAVRSWSARRVRRTGLCERRRACPTTGNEPLHRAHRRRARAPSLSTATSSD